MANSKIKDPSLGSGSKGSGGDNTRGLPGITTADTTTQQLLVQTAQEVVQSLTNFNGGLAGLSALQQQQATATQQNTLALEQNTSGKSSGAASTIESAAASLLGGGGLLAPLINGIMGLFGGGSSSAASTAVPQAFSLPAPIAVQATVDSSAATTAAPAGGGASAGTSVIVQVNAMDSRSFLDHKDEIAQAVREAVLHSHALNDVLNQL
jgi:hypothetical protein